MSRPLDVGILDCQQAELRADAQQGCESMGDRGARFTVVVDAVNGHAVFGGASAKAAAGGNTEQGGAALPCVVVEAQCFLGFTAIGGHDHEAALRDVVGQRVAAAAVDRQLPGLGAERGEVVTGGRRATHAGEDDVGRPCRSGRKLELSGGRPRPRQFETDAGDVTQHPAHIERKESRVIEGTHRETPAMAIPESSTALTRDSSRTSV